jgi:hypothetical protein
MATWFLLIGFILPTPPGPSAQGALSATEEMRYRGIEQLFAKFEADRQDAGPLQNR